MFCVYSTALVSKQGFLHMIERMEKRRKGAVRCGSDGSDRKAKNNWFTVAVSRLLGKT